MREMELTYEAVPGVPLPSLDGLPRVAAVSGPEIETLAAEYYDTEDLRLFRAGGTLRRWAGGAAGGAGAQWQLELPGEAARHEAARREVRVPAGGPGGPVPDELACLVRAYTRGAALRPVARVQTRRRRMTLRDATGASLAEVLADEVTAQTFGASTVLTRWNEVGVEPTGGGPRLLRAADRHLRDGGLRRAGRSVALARALGAEPPRPRRARRLAGRPAAGEVVLAYLDAQAARLASLDAAVRRDLPDSVHQMRVTTRRLRSALQSFPAILPEPATRHLRGELRWLGAVLGEARDGEVLSEYLLTQLAGVPAELAMGPVRARIRAYFAPREGSARNAVLQALDSGRYVAMLDELDRLLGDPPLTAAAAAPADEILPRAVARAYRRTRRRMRRAKRAAAGPDRDVALHQTRKAAKRARYAAEAARPALGRRAARLADRMKAVQSVLGRHQDAVNARALAREIGVQAHLAGENAFSFGLLYERADQDARRRQDEASRAWKRAARHGGRAWPAAG
ncbi:MAG TPA: CYTH and CHAD domain-containing protein [Trebonia sp.]|nr:CYTH and CHAD domain-containing protein [Trebonia sp.]